MRFEIGVDFSTPPDMFFLCDSIEFQAGEDSWYTIISEIAAN